MLDSVQKWLDQEIGNITEVNKRWVDVFKPNKKNSENEVVIRLNTTQNSYNSCSEIEYKTYTFEIFVVGTDKRTNTRELTEKIYDALNLRTGDFLDINLMITKTRNQSFQFLENDKTSVNRFEIEILAQYK
jgi:hypothetical protein